MDTKVINGPDRNLSADDKIAINCIAREGITQEIKDLKKRAAKLGMKLTAFRLGDSIKAANTEIEI